MEEETKQGNRLEADKLQYDLFKHMSVLSTGTVVASAAIVKGLFQDPSEVYLVGYAFILFLVAILGSLFGMAAKTVQVKTGRPYKGAQLNISAAILAVAIVSFITGFCLVSAFVYQNI